MAAYNYFKLPGFWQTPSSNHDHCTCMVNMIHVSVFCTFSDRHLLTTITVHLVFCIFFFYLPFFNPHASLQSQMNKLYRTRLMWCTCNHVFSLNENLFILPHILSVVSNHQPNTCSSLKVWWLFSFYYVYSLYTTVKTRVNWMLVLNSAVLSLT